MGWAPRLILILVGIFMSSTSLFAQTNMLEKKAIPVSLSAEEREWITAHPVLRVGVLTNWAPFTYPGPDGKPIGIDIDILNLISQRTGLRFTVFPYASWDDLVANSNHLDVVCSITETPERARIVEFTEQYSTAPIVIIQREGQETFGSAILLRDKKLALPRRHVITQLVTKLVPSAHIVLAPTQDDCFELVAKKKADATIVNLFVASQYLNSHPHLKLDISGVVAQSDQPMKMAVRRSIGSAVPVAILNKGLTSISQHELDDIFAKHLLLGLQARQRIELIQRRAKQILIPLAVAAVLILAWNCLMQKEIRCRRRAEADLRAANESMKIFTHSLSHDLRSPLRGITGLAQALKEDHYEKLDDEGKNYLDRIITSGSGMERMIADVLTYTRTAGADWPMDRVALDPLMNQLIESFPPHQRQYFQIASELPAVRGHPTLLRQCFGNLLANALKFIPTDRTPQIVVRATEDDDVVTVFVEDNGIGIDAKDRKRIFEIFQRAAPGSFEGTGVGLAVAAKAAERMQGSVGVDSKPGEGSQFWVQLPSTSAAKTVPQSSHSESFWHRFAFARGT